MTPPPFTHAGINRFAKNRPTSDIHSLYDSGFIE
jgi:hypothetical protein